MKSKTTIIISGKQKGNISLLRSFNLQRSQYKKMKNSGFILYFKNKNIASAALKLAYANLKNAHVQDLDLKRYTGNLLACNNSIAAIHTIYCF